MNLAEKNLNWKQNEQTQVSMNLRYNVIPHLMITAAYFNVKYNSELLTTVALVDLYINILYKMC
jgi:hypothetical protein